MLDYWKPVLWVLLCVQLPVIVLNRLELPFEISFGFRSFSRNVAIFMVLGVWLGAPGLPRPRSSLTLPMLVFFFVIGASVALGGGRWADVRSFGVAIGLFYGARSLAADAEGRRRLFHWIGLVVLGTVVAEIVGNPEILRLRESLRHTMVTAHPNTLGGVFAIFSPLFLGASEDRSARRMAPVYLVAAILGVVFTFSRLALGGLLVGSAVVLLADRLRRSPARLVLSGVVAACVVVGAIFYLSLGRAEADWQRLQIIYTSLTLFAESWPLGIGYGVENLEALFPSRYEEIYGQPLWLFHSHNMYVDLLVGTGVFGMASAVWLFWRLLRVGWRAVRDAPPDPAMRRVGAGLAGTVVVFLWVGIGDMPLYHERLLFPLVMAWGLMDGWANRLQTAPD